MADSTRAGNYPVISSSYLDISTKHSIPRVLSLDGGGVRGLSSLLILREIMESVGARVGAFETPKPCEYFDLIGGTGSGGVLAIMLGTLNMASSPVWYKNNK